MKLLNLSIKVVLFFLFGLILFMVGRLLAVDVSTDCMVDAGFTLLEQILIFTGVGGGALAGILIKVARQGTKAVLKSLDSNPHINNPDLVRHARSQGDNKMEQLFKQITDV